MISSKKCEDAAQFQAKNRQQNHYPNSISFTVAYCMRHTIVDLTGLHVQSFSDHFSSSESLLKVLDMGHIIWSISPTKFFADSSH